MAKLYNFKYKGSDRSVYALATEHKAELSRHEAAMQKFIKSAYRKFLVKNMDDPVKIDF